MINQNQHIINRKVAIVKNGYNAAKLAREIKVTPQAISQAIRGITHSLRIHRAIAHKLGVTLAELWPELYGPMPDVDPVSHDATVNDQAGAVN